jgi:hypothetical protein
MTINASMGVACIRKGLIKGTFSHHTGVHYLLHRNIHLVHVLAGVGCNRKQTHIWSDLTKLSKDASKAVGG